MSRPGIARGSLRGTTIGSEEVGMRRLWHDIREHPFSAALFLGYWLAFWVMSWSLGWLGARVGAGLARKARTGTTR